MRGAERPELLETHRLVGLRVSLRARDRTCLEETVLVNGIPHLDRPSFETAEIVEAKRESHRRRRFRRNPGNQVRSCSVVVVIRSSDLCRIKGSWYGNDRIELSLRKERPMQRTNRRRRERRRDIPFSRGRGGARPRAGRKPKGDRAGVAHGSRSALASRYPVHVTLRVVEGLPGLRQRRLFCVVREAFAKGSDRFGFRLVHFTVMSNHMHLIVEAKNRRALSRGMQGLCVRIARAVNRCLGRMGSVFADRYHDHILHTPREVRAALAYVLRNAARHGLRFVGPDPCSSGFSFDGWRIPRGGVDPTSAPSPVARARSWLLRRGWRRHRRIGLDERPRG